MTHSSVPETSIIIRAYNEERWLPELFTALHKQKYRDFEALLVDSGSIDRTRDIAAANGARILHLRSEDFTFGYSLNLGIAEAKGVMAADAVVEHGAMIRDVDHVAAVDAADRAANADDLRGRPGARVEAPGQDRDGDARLHRGAKGTHVLRVRLAARTEEGPIEVDGEELGLEAVALGSLILVISLCGGLARFARLHACRVRGEFWRMP